MRTIVLNDGTTFEGNCGYADGFLWCYVKNVAEQVDMAIFLDPDATSRIVYHYGEMTDTYEWFVFNQLQAVEDGYNVCFRKGVVDNV